MPRSVQGHPVIIQAGASGRGKAFGAQWGEVIFQVYPNLDVARRDYAEFKADVARHGRDPEHVTVAQLLNTVSAATKAEAEDKWALIDKLPLEIDALSLLSEVLNFDLATKGMDERFTDEEMAGISGMRAFRDRVVRVSGIKNPTVREFIKYSGRGRVHDPVVGGPKEICDRMEQWFVERACDGFVVSATHVPGAYEDFVRFIVPELQRRGLFRKDFAGQRCARTWACRCRRSARGGARERQRPDREQYRRATARDVDVSRSGECCWKNFSGNTVQVSRRSWKF